MLPKLGRWRALCPKIASALLRRMMHPGQLRQEIARVMHALVARIQFGGYQKMCGSATHQARHATGAASSIRVAVKG